MISKKMRNKSNKSNQKLLVVIEREKKVAVKVSKKMVTK